MAGRRYAVLTTMAVAVAVASAGIGAARAAGSGAEPARFRLCAIDVDYPPYARIDGTGHLQYLLVQAARNLGLEVERRVAPRRRCVEELRAGVVDGMVGAYSAERAEYGVFPGVEGDVDERKALATPRYFLYRRKGGVAEWDGQRFARLGEGRLGVESGFVLIIERLRQAGVRYDDGAKTLELNLDKLVNGRLDGVIGMEAEADKLVAARYAGKIERAGKPFEQTPLYLMVSRQFHALYPRFTERYWQAQAEYLTTPDYRQYQLTHP
ncbi:substrate-binding periplasmic protein [Pseudoduganella namucuonensis]|uniref:Transporter substrate-binding domain-containing protein n=1 Tax=Pseudoduganella namucuonensis TaxID=1035707 RepID=A0A1I7LLI5_9BURK|nr:transporter substrate-binding domain-containing protein [Pseudoduganella namucuonensis]SFV10582.1 hypothetical protein SAMN05216552_10326 [Pseudoduganella namucuonensis]